MRVSTNVCERAHSHKPNFDAPYVPGKPAGAAEASAAAEPSAEAVDMLANMGFAHEHVRAASAHADQSLERAADWLFAHADDLHGAVAAPSGGGRRVGRAAGRRRG